MRAILLACLIALTSYHSARATLIVNGGFESPGLVGLDQVFHAPSSEITGWTVTGGSVDLIQTGSSVLGDSHTGSQLIDINGSSSGTIEQVFETVPDANYVLELYYSNNPNPSSARPIYAANVSVFGRELLASQDIEHAGATQPNMDWQLLLLPFKADSATSRLHLRSLTSGNNGVYFDSISVTLGFLPQPGDTDDDGDVDLTDLNNVRNHFGDGEILGPSVFGEAYPFDGVVDLGDLVLVRNQFGNSTATLIPEPSTFLLALAGGLLVHCHS